MLTDTKKGDIVYIPQGSDVMENYQGNQHDRQLLFHWSHRTKKPILGIVLNEKSELRDHIKVYFLKKDPEILNVQIGYVKQKHIYKYEENNASKTNTSR
jgi:hypothetical protein